MKRLFFSAVLLVLAAATVVGAESTRTHQAPGLGEYDTPFYPNGEYRSSVESPGEFLGYPLGSRPASPDDIIAYLEYLAENSGTVTLHDYGTTYEGRRLVYLVVTSEKNTENLAGIRSDLAKLADPRKLGNRKDASRIISNSPAVAWVAYGIHGDEFSSCDAALQLAYQLAAGTDSDTRIISDELIVCIDPCENPDGRNRALQQMTQFNGAVPNDDIQSLAHRGSWPRGRTNHYLFDLNRDWFSTVHPESRGRIEAILDWMPHYLLDAHEMGPTDTYMFSPPREPFNPYMVPYIYKWWKRVADDHGYAFDKYGWSYYTREWNEEIYPGYGSSWGIFLGAVGMLFEQAGVDGSRVKRREGTVMTYRETVHHQFLGSFSNLLTIAQGREELLSDYYDVKLDNVETPNGKSGAFLFPPTPNSSRLIRFAEALERQHIEIESATSSFKISDAVSANGTKIPDKTFPEGTLIVRTRQPLKQLIETILTFDIRLPTSFLEIEKKEILKRNRSKIYEVTGWSLPLGYDVESYYTKALPGVSARPHESPEIEGGLVSGDSQIGFVFDCTDDRSYDLLVKLLDHGYEVTSSRKPFENKGRLFPRGSFQVRYDHNPELVADELARLAEDCGVKAFGIETTIGDKYADLGGGEFALLERPRIALVGGDPVSSNSFGACWHLLDCRFGLRISLLEAGSLSRMDLDRYNVLVLPGIWGDPGAYKRLLGKHGISRLTDWVKSGGTLIGVGNASAFLADSSVAVSAVRSKRQILEKLASYDRDLEAAEDAESPEIDSLAVWEGVIALEKQKADEKTGKPDRAQLDTVKAADTIARKLRPRGTILSVDLDDEHWLTIGCNNTVPVMFRSDYAYMAPGGVQVPGRFAGAKKIRLSGLLWPEARERWNKTAYVTREAKGKGQVILFASLPNFRGYFHGAERLLLNAMFLGPGFGARQSIEW